MAISKVLHILTLGIWTGGVVSFGFLFAPEIFSFLAHELPASPPAEVKGMTEKVGRRLAGDLVARIFPGYFLSQVCLGVLAVGTGVVLYRAGRRLDRVRCGLVAVALAVVAMHAVTIYPRSSRVLEEHYRAAQAGDLPRAAELRRQFGQWHGVSRVLDLATLLLVLAALALAGLGLPPHGPAAGRSP